MDSNTPIKLKHPAQDLQAFSLFALDAEARRLGAGLARHQHPLSRAAIAPGGE